MFTVCSAQDTIILKNRERIIAPVMEVADVHVIYASQEEPAGNKKVLLDSILQINYKSGYIEKIGKPVVNTPVVSSGKFAKEKSVIPDISVTIADSFQLGANVSYSYFDLLKSGSPVVAYSEGIYMPTEKIWYLKTPDSCYIYAFAISHVDTSAYIFYDYKNNVYLKNYARGISINTQTASDLLWLDKEHSYTLFPTGRLSFFLLAHDTVSRVFYCTQQGQKEIFRSKNKILGIVPLDSFSFVFFRRDELVFYNFHGHQYKILFKSPVAITSAVILQSGVPVIATTKGIFRINKDYTAGKLNININDGMLKLYNNYLYVLSNANHKIYKLKI